MGTEKTWQDFKTLEEFAEHARIQASNVLYALWAGRVEEATEQAAALTTLSGTVARQGAMAREVEDPQRYALSALSVDLRQAHPETDEDEDGEENPFRGE